MNEISYKVIGCVHSPYKNPEGTPIQPAASTGDVFATVEFFPEYAEGLKDLEGFSHIYVLFHLHCSTNKSLQVTPFLDNEPHGVFATRSPGRPNPIGLSVVELIKIEGNLLTVKNPDMLDGSPVLDIKPYVSKFDVFETTKNGWLEKNLHKMIQVKDDGRFNK